MNETMPHDVLSDLADAQTETRKKRSKRTLRVGGQRFVILRHWDAGFALDVRETPPSRGLVDFYEGERHLGKALVMQSHDAGGERVFEVKYMTHVSHCAPSVDFVRDDEAPVGLLPAS